MDIRIAGEDALIVYLGSSISATTSTRVQLLCRAIEAALPREIVDLIPSYHSVVVVFDPSFTSSAVMKQKILSLDIADGPVPEQETLVELPVYYSTESGHDLERVARFHNITTDEVIRAHSNRDYRVYAIGFAPGFAYLGEVDRCIATPRLPSPRLRVPKGSVAIADTQTAVYPATSPGGWNLIGCCPTTLFDHSAATPVMVSVGDKIRFHAVDRREFLKLGGHLG